MSLASLRGPGPLKYSYLVSSFNTFTRGMGRRVEVKEEEEEKKIGIERRKQTCKPSGGFGLWRRQRRRWVGVLQRL